MAGKIFNIGSINVDHVYRVNEMPAPGETITAISCERFLGGKGINQSIASAKAGGETIHVGAIAEGDTWVRDQIRQFGVGVDQIANSTHDTGHAIIYVDDAGENEIVIFGGANQNLEISRIENVLNNAGEGDWVLIQNETNLLEEIVSQAEVKGLKIAYAAAPFVAEIAVALLDKIDLLAVNKGEANQLAEAMQVEPEHLPVPMLLITRGESGAVFLENGKHFDQSAFAAKAVDTTGAGDTFLGSFLANYVRDGNASAALEYAAAASSIQVTRPGAATAIPEREEVEAFLKRHTKT